MSAGGCDAAEAFSALAERLVDEPHTSQPIRKQAAGNGLGVLSQHVLRAELGRMQLLNALQLDAIFDDIAALDKGGHDVERDDLVELDRFFEMCFLGRLELLRRTFRANCGSGQTLFGSALDPDGACAGADYMQFRRQARNSGLAADTMRESELRQLFDFIDEGRRGRVDPERFDEIVGMGLDQSLTTQRSAELTGPLLLRIAAALDRRGEEGLALLQRLQQAPAGALPGCVAREPFRQALRQLGVPLSQIDAELLYVLLDRASDGTVCISQLLAAVSRHAKKSLGDAETPTLKVHRQRLTVKRSHITPGQQPYSDRLAHSSGHSRSPSPVHRVRASAKSQPSELHSSRLEADEADLEYQRDDNWYVGMARKAQVSDRRMRSDNIDGRAMDAERREVRELVLLAHDEGLDRSDLESVARALCDRTISPGLRTLLRAEGGISALVDVLRRGTTAARSVAAQALATLGADGDRHQDELAQSGAVRYLVQMLDERHWTTISFTSRDNEHEDSACAAALECIAVIAHGCVHSASVLGQSGAIDGVVRALGRRGGLRTRGLLCLRALAASTANKPRVAEAGSVPLLLRCSQEAVEDQDEETLAQAVSVMQSLALTPSCQTQLVDYSTIETLEACVRDLQARIDPSTQRLIEQLSESLADERQRRTIYEIEWDTQPCSEWSVGALASWVAAPGGIGLPEHATSFRRLDVDGPLFVATLHGSTERTLAELWQELGVEHRRDQTIILDALCSRGQSMNARASLLSANVSRGEYAVRGRSIWDRRHPRLFSTWLVRAAREIFWIQTFRVAQRALGSWQKQKHFLRMLLLLYILFSTSLWLLTPSPLSMPPPPPTPPPPPPLITEIFSLFGWMGLVAFLWTAVAVASLSRIQGSTTPYEMCETLVRRGAERLRVTFRHSPRRKYRCVGSCPVAITLHADPSLAGWNDFRYFTATNERVSGTEVGQVVPGEVIEVLLWRSSLLTAFVLKLRYCHSLKCSGQVLEFRVISGRIRARCSRGWVDLVTAQGARLLEDVVVLPPERCFITILPENRLISGSLRRTQDPVAVRRSPLISCRTTPASCIVDNYICSGNDTLHAEENILATRASFGEDEVCLVEAMCVRAIPATANRPLENARIVNGCVVVIDRGGGVPFITKARHAQVAGAVGVIIINDMDDPLTAYGHRNLDGTLDGGADVCIPVVCVRKTGGEVLVAKLPTVVNMGEMEVACDRPDTL